MNKILHPSLELNWLPNSLLKSIPTPEIYTVSTADYGGCYYHICEEYKRGRIILTEDYFNPGTIAHEWRHCWQENNGSIGSSDWGQHASDKSYKEAIVSYFTEQPHEMDALLFELKYAPNDGNLQWWEWIINDSKT